MDPLFLCGHPKSGTTLLLALLDFHPNLLVFPEETFFFRGLRHLQSLDQKRRFLLESSPVGKISAGRLKTSVEGSVEKDRDYSSIDGSAYCKDLEEALKKTTNDRELFWTICDVWKRHAPQNRKDRITLSLTPHSQGGGEDKEHSISSSPLTGEDIGEGGREFFRYFVEKTPRNEQFVPRIEELFSQKARYIHIIRDPRDVYASIRHRFPKLTPEDFSKDWKRLVQKSLRYRDHPRHHFIRYEDLVENPEETLQHLCQFLNIPFRDILLTPTRMGTPWEGNSLFEGRLENTIHKKATGQFASTLSRNTVSKVEQYCFSEMQEWGFQPRHATASRPLPLWYRSWRIVRRNYRTMKHWLALKSV